jgi:hypothetical protein
LQTSFFTYSNMLIYIPTCWSLCFRKWFYVNKQTSSFCCSLYWFWKGTLWAIQWESVCVGLKQASKAAPLYVSLLSIYPSLEA